MENPLEVIQKIKDALQEIICENKFLSNLNTDLETLLNLYSADFVGIMLKFYPGATVMMNKSYRKCAIMIASKVYDSQGLTNRSDYHIAENYEIDYIRKTFNMLSDDVFFKLSGKLFPYENDYSSCYTLRKNKEYLA